MSTKLQTKFEAGIVEIDPQPCNIPTSALWRHGRTANVCQFDVYDLSPGLVVYGPLFALPKLDDFVQTFSYKSFCQESIAKFSLYTESYESRKAHFTFSLTVWPRRLGAVISEFLAQFS